jgi:hypothetical protein
MLVAMSLQGSGSGPSGSTMIPGAAAGTGRPTDSPAGWQPHPEQIMLMLVLQVGCAVC